MLYKSVRRNFIFLSFTFAITKLQIKAQSAYVEKNPLKPQDSLEAKLNVGSEKTCGFCLFLINRLHDVLQQNQTEVDIEQYLLSACALLPTKNESNKVVFYLLN